MTQNQSYHLSNAYSFLILFLVTMLCCTNIINLYHTNFLWMVTNCCNFPSYLFVDRDFFWRNKQSSCIFWQPELMEFLSNRDFMSLNTATNGCFNNINNEICLCFITIIHQSMYMVSLATYWVMLTVSW